MKVTIDFKNVQEDTLTEVIIALEHARACQIDCQQSYVLDCPDQTAAAILQTLFGGNGTQPVRDSKASKKVKPEKKPHKGHARVALFTVLNGTRKGEIIKHQTLNRLLREHLLEKGTHLTHIKRGELIVVANEEDAESPYFTISAIGQQLGENQAAPA